MDAPRTGTRFMPDLTPRGSTEPPRTPSTAAENPAAPMESDDRPGRYDANVQLILRRLADHQRTDTKPRWWWQNR